MDWKKHLKIALDSAILLPGLLLVWWILMLCFTGWLILPGADSIRAFWGIFWLPFLGVKSDSFLYPYIGWCVKNFLGTWGIILAVSAGIGLLAFLLSVLSQLINMIRRPTSY